MAHDETGVVIVELLEDQGADHVVEGGQVLRLRNQQQFKLPVIHDHILAAELQEASNGGGVGHGPEEEAPLKHLAVGLDPGPVVAQGGEILHPLDDIGQMAQVVFDVLRHGIGGLGKGPEGGDVDEVPVIEAAHVQMPPGAGDNEPGRLHRVGGEPEAGGEVVGAAPGDVAQRRRVSQGHQAVDRLVEGAVPAVAHHKIKAGALLAGQTLGVPGALGLLQAYQISGLGKNGNHIKKERAGAAPPRPGIDDQKQCFGHGICSPRNF